MGSLKLAPLAVATLLASTALANAADLMPPPIEDFPPEVPVAHHSSSGHWYIRGDIGYAAADVDGVTYQQYQGNGAALNTGSFSQFELDGSWGVQAGIGYQATDYFRVDATLKHMFGGDFDGQSAAGTTLNCAGATVLTSLGGNCSYNDDTELESATLLMANAYVDLGTFNSITPYLGAGIGGAHVKWGDLYNDQTCTGAALAANAACSTFDYNHAGESGWRFAWAIHAGASYEVNCRTKIDAGYTFTRIEGGNMFGSGRHAVTGNQAGGYGWDNGIDFHEGRVGLRYALDSSNCQQPVHHHQAPPPLVFK